MGGIGEDLAKFPRFYLDRNHGRNLGDRDVNKGKPCLFVGSWLEKKGLKNLCVALQGKIYRFDSIFCVKEG